MTEDEVKELAARFKAAKAERAVWEPHWQDIALLVSPRKADFTGERTPGSKRNRQVLDSTGIRANELLAAGLNGIASNPASKWFTLRMTDDRLNELPEVRGYLSDVENIMRAEMYAPGTGLPTALHEAYLDLGAFGTGDIFIGQRDNGGLLFKPNHLAQVYIAENSDGIVDTHYTETKQTVKQLVDDYGINGVPKKVQKLFEKNKWHERVTVVHAVEPRKGRDVTAKDSVNMAWMGVYFDPDSKHLYEETGYPEWPFSTPRWSKRPGETYGRSPGMTALPDIKLLQAMMRTTITAAQKQADPPLFLPHKGMFGGIRGRPGGLNYYRGSRADIFSMPFTGSLAVTESLMVEIRNRILSIFSADMLQMFTDAKMTATEVQQRVTERMRLLGPVLGQLESELLSPMISRVFAILDRAGKLPPVPEIASEAEFTVEYVSPIATAQRQNEAESILQVVNFAAPFLQTDPQLLTRVYNGDRVVRHLSRIFNVDPDLLNKEEVSSQKAQLEQLMPMLQQLLVASQAANQGADAASKLSAANEAGGLPQLTFQGPGQGPGQGLGQGGANG